MNPTRNRSCLCFIFLLNTCVFSDPGVPEPHLRLLNVVFRHGDRTPSQKNEMFPNDPYVNDDFYPVGRGELTNKGKLREYELGVTLRNRYDEFLGKFYEPSTLVARSTDYARTIMSLQLVLNGLYPPQDIQKWNENVNWQPIPTYSAPSTNDKLLMPDECANYLDEYYRVRETPEVLDKVNQFRDFMARLTAWTNKTVSSTADFYHLYHTFAAEASMGLKLPDWSKAFFPKGKLEDGIVLEYEIANYNTLLRRLNGGPLVNEMTEGMKMVMNGTMKKGRKLFLYSGHESSIVSLSYALGVYEPHVPGYSSAVIVELWQLENEHFVKVLYHRGDPPVINELKIPGCQVLCPFDTFLKLTKDVIPVGDEWKCEKHKNPRS